MSDSEMWESRRNSAIYTETTGYNDRELYSWEGRGATGFSLGIIELTANIPFAPGNMNNASTFDFPVRYLSLGDIEGDNPVDMVGVIFSRMPIVGSDPIIGGE